MVPRFLLAILFAFFSTLTAASAAKLSRGFTQGTCKLKILGGADGGGEAQCDEVVPCPTATPHCDPVVGQDGDVTYWRCKCCDSAVPTPTCVEAYHTEGCRGILNYNPTPGIGWYISCAKIDCQNTCTPQGTGAGGTGMPAQGATVDPACKCQ